MKTKMASRIIFLFAILIGVRGIKTECFHLVKCNNKFGMDLFREITSNLGSEENTFISPESISSALSMTSLGARGQTLAQMLHVMQVENVSYRNEKFAELNTILLRNAKGANLEIANKLFGDKSYAFLPQFMAGARKFYGAALERVNFKKSEIARNEVNKWVEEKTHDKIKNLLPAGSINPSTKLVLVNALYFKGHWKYAFKKRFTHKGKFHLTNNQVTEVQYMRSKNDYKMAYLRDFNAKGLELPYESDRFRMLIFMPYEIQNFGNFEDKFNSLIIDSFDRHSFKHHSLLVTLPKFKITFESKLKGVLSKMGMPDLFDSGKANLSGMDGTRGLFMSQIFHKAFVNVNEEGTEAAAATGAIIMLRAMMRPVVFTVDRPFIFVIQDNLSGTVLFLGRIKNP